jgi:adenylate cyclase
MAFFRTHLQRALRLAPALVIAWATASFVAARLSGMAAVEALPVGVSLLRALATGLLVGLPAAWLETVILAWTDRRFSVGASLTIRTAAYAVVVTVATVGLVYALNEILFGSVPESLFGEKTFGEFVTDRAFLTLLALLLTASFIVNLTIQLRRVLGPQTLMALLVGRYRRPVREDRAFLFLDLTDSTPTAEKLGPFRFTDFKNDFFTDVAEAVVATRGRIFQYVGDEVVVTWPLAQAIREGGPIRCFFLVEDLVAQRAAHYQARYGTVPRFKAGTHGGEVVTAEIGDIRRDIVHSGDVVNTTARIEAQCRPLGRRLLVSESLADRMRTARPALDRLFRFEPVGAIELRGKADAVGLVSVERTGEVRHGESARALGRAPAEVSRSQAPQAEIAPALRPPIPKSV